MITVAIQCYNFEHRLCWMLSSIIDAKLCGMSVHLSYFENSLCDHVCEFFSDKIEIARNKYDNLEDLQYRGLTRTIAIRECATEWLLFADSDHVYHPEFFQRLICYIRDNDLRKYDGILTAGRLSCDRNKANSLVSDFRYPKKIQKPWFLADTTLDSIRRSNVGAGYFQLINLDYCNHEGYYVSAEECRDGSWVGGIQKAKSDQQFRRRIGKKHRLPNAFTLMQRHLNHYRDNEFGVHLEIQR